QWGGSPLRNNAPEAKEDEVPLEWDVESGENIRWRSLLGSQTYGNPVVANGQVYVGTNNGAGWLSRYKADVDLGVLLAFDEKDGKFLWQHSSEKLPTGRVHDWPLQGICASTIVEGDRVWFVTSRGEVRCLDSKGFHDGENDGPYKDEKFTATDEADVIWVYDMMQELGVSQHNMCSCSMTAIGDVLFVCTSNGVDESHIIIPGPNAPAFLAMDKNTGKVLWTDNSPGLNILHGQWSSPCYAEINGQAMVIFAGGDGWLHCFDPVGENGKSKELWKFDCNPKETKWILGGRGTRNEVIATPVVYKDRIYVAVGQDPEHGEGQGHLWCIDPNRRGDVSPELVFNSADNFAKPIEHKRLCACEPEKGDVARPNPNSAVIWHYDVFDLDGDKKIEFEETMHRTIGTVAIRDDILYVADFSGLFHCVDAKTGKPYWTYDMLAASWGSPLIAGKHVFMGDEDGDIAIFNHSTEKDAAEPVAEINMGNSVYTTPVFANGTLFISNKTHLFAIQKGAKSEITEDKRSAESAD
ncbi:MAG TPA: PQQ-binding-like beta-propeller repeat protein, partial [Pirellulales bacterium]